VLAGRALRAAQLVAADKVHLDTTCHRVESQTCPERRPEPVEGPSRRNGAGEYQVEQIDGTWRCTCPDWQASFAGELFGAPVVGRGPKCKHILAVLMAIRLRGDSSAPPHPSTPAQSWWDHQQALARFQEYARRVQEEGADPRLLFVLSQML